jgi:hypothetical protein
MEKEHFREVRRAHEKAREKLGTAEIRRKAPKEHRRTQGWLRQVAMPGEASGDARLASPGSDARWREEVMTGGTSGEVMPLSAGGFRSQSLLCRGKFRFVG